MSTQKIRALPVKTFDSATVDINTDDISGKRHLALGKGDCPPSIAHKGGEQTKKDRRTFLDDMDSIAYGVEVWFEENTDYSRRVTDTTVDIARALGIPEDEIKRWAAYRARRDTLKLWAIKSILGRL